MICRTGDILLIILHSPRKMYSDNPLIFSSCRHWWKRSKLCNIDYYTVNSYCNVSICATWVAVSTDNWLGLWSGPWSEGWTKAFGPYSQVYCDFLPATVATTGLPVALLRERELNSKAKSVCYHVLDHVLKPCTCLFLYYGHYSL